MSCQEESYKFGKVVHIELKEHGKKGWDSGEEREKGRESVADLEGCGNVGKEVFDRILRKLEEKESLKLLHREKGNLVAGLNIGADWIEEKKIAVIVYPKIKNLDFVKMFLEVFNNPEIVKQLDYRDMYEIKVDAPFITIEKEKQVDVTPLLIAHFFTVVRKIVKKGLKKDYVLVEENLNSKIKGKLVIKEQIRRNNFKGRYDRNYCRYQDITTDIPLNRILKRALIFSRNYLRRGKLEAHGELLNLAYELLSYFKNVGDKVDIRRVRIPRNPFYREYRVATKLAIQILKRFDYSIKKSEKEGEYSFVPPFRINMPLLFELYVYSRLLKAKRELKVENYKIGYQSKGKYGEPDFLLYSKQDLREPIIADAKYKPKYQKDQYDISDIRQVSGYARDCRIIKKLTEKDCEDKDVPIIKSLIIYPAENNKNAEVNLESLNNIEKIFNPSNKIEQFYKFYKVSVSLPRKEVPKNNQLNPEPLIS